jgi:hypothetical protein
MASIDRVMALAEEIKKKKKNPNYEINQSLVNVNDIANDVRSGKKNVLQDYMGYDRSGFAPIRSLNEEEERSWFKKGFFEDGYDFGDLTKTVVGSSADLYKNVVKGALNIGESVIDAGAYVAGGAGKLLGNDEFADKTKKFIAKDIINEDELANRATNTGTPIGWVNNLLNGEFSSLNPFDLEANVSGKAIEQGSVFGDKSDSLAQSGGQLAATFGLQAIGVPWWLTTGATSFGGEVEEAFNQDATYGEAGFSGLVSAGAEVLTEKISGGISFGGKTLDTGLKKLLAEKISNKTLSTLTKFGVDATLEGFEEVATEVISNVGKKLSYEDEKTWGEMLASEEAMDSYLEAFIGGSVLGGGFNVGRATSSIKTGRDYDTGLTTNEQKVVDKEVESRIAEQEQAGNKVTNKQKAEIEKQVRNDLEKGYISTDAIESTLGGETYNQLKSTRDTKIDLENKISELENMPDNQITVKQKEQLQAYREQLKSIDTNTLESQLQSEMGQNIKSDAYLQRSYQEKSNRSVKFEADLSKYDAKQQAVVQKAIDSGILNNTNRTHDFVDMVAKISSDKGISFDFTNNENLKKSGFAVEGKTVNGYIQDGNIAVNIDSSKALNRVVGHEITHVLEGTELYTELQAAVKQYATTKGEYDTRLADLTNLYKNVKGANVENELTADLVGDYLFTDPDFINNLSTEKPSLFKKVYNEIKHLYNMATAGSKEARELLKVKKAFEKAYKENVVSRETTNEVSVSETTTEATSKVDNLGRELSAEQIAFFEDSKVVDENGNLLVMYHGTGNEFDVFDINKSGQHYEDGWSAYGRGFYFTVDKAKAEEFSKEAEGNNKHVKEVYLNVKNPFYANEDATELFEKYGLEPFINSTGRDFITQINVRDGRDASTKILQELGYDGVIETFGEKGIDEVVVFNENQIKSVDNKKPTLDKNINYSLSEAGTLVDSQGNEVSLEVNDTGTHGTLMAIHNLSEEKLKGILELGGFPVPSIAIMNTSTTYLDYGNISVLFDKNTIDPAVKENEVYGSDVYSPRFPQTVQKINEKELSKLEKYLGKRLYLENTTLEETVQKNRYTNEFIKKFAEENNIKVDNVYKESGFNYTFSTDENVKNFIIENDITFEKLLNDTELRNKFYELYRESSTGILKGLTERKIEIFEKAFADNNINIGSRLDSDFNSIKNGSEKVLDEYATEKALRDKVLEQYESQYTNFLNEKFSPVFEEKYIRNNKELYTPSGNRRSFKQLYNEYTLDNVVKEMKGKVRGEEGFFYGAGNIRSQVTPQFKTIADIKANADKLVTNSQMKSVKEDIDSDLSNLSEMAKNYGGYSYDSYEGALNEIAGLKKITSVKAKSILNDYGFKNVPDILVDKSIEFLEKLKNAPTEYFEAKPQRAVGLDEVQAIIVPNYIDATLKQQLMDNGLNVIEYDPNIEGDKQSKINQFDELKFSLSNQNEAIAPSRNDVFGSDISLDIAPIQEEIQALTETITELRNNMESAITKAIPDNVVDMGKANTVEDLPMIDKIRDDSFKTLEAPTVTEEEVIPEYEENTSVESPFDNRDIDEVGKRSIKAYQYENPEVRPFFQQEARAMLEELNDSIKGERYIIGDTSQNAYGDYEYSGTKRMTSPDIEYLLDNFNYTYTDIEKGLRAIIEDHGAENIAVAKRIEFILDERLRNGYDTFGTMSIYEPHVEPNQAYINLLQGMEQAEFYSNAPIGEAPYVEEASITEEIAPVREQSEAPNRAAFNEAVRESARVVERDLGYTPQNPTQESTYDEIAEILTEEPTTASERNQRKLAIIAANVLDKGLVFENVSLKNKNRELMGKWDYTLTSEARAQTAIGQGHYDNETGKTISKSLNEIMEEVNNTGLTKQFYEYIYHKHNVDRMQLADKFEGIDNKPVFGFDVTAADSQEIVNQYEFSNPEFIGFAHDVYDYVNADRKLLVDNGVISQETADLWAEMYPHYVPIRREGHNGNAINVPLDTGRTGINAPIKKATGGSSNILPLFDTMAMRTLQTYRATAKNSFGVELMKTLGTKIESTTTNVDEVIDSVDAQESLLQENNGKPTFTVFENGEKITFSITKDMYDALKPLSDSSILSKTIKPLNIASSFHRGLLTQYNPVFALTNGIKDMQDILLNSQHAVKTYSKIPEAYAQVLKKGYWYQEYMANGGEHNSYFDSQDNTFKTENTGIKKMLDLPPLKQIAQLNDFIEIIPRLSEYIASREMGRSIEVSMLDAARVTTNFKAGGNLTKFLNRNGVTFLNASVQGAMQQVRNIREAKANGIKGWANLATKFTMAGLPAILLNALLWDDDEEYEELSDYVKQNYYVVAKTDDGKFIRIPKGRTVAVIQDAVEQMKNFVTGDDEVDLASFIDLFLTNLAPSNPIDNNVFAPIIQAVSNETWYGEDLVPTRLQDLPAAEQYDESTDSFSKWLGGVLNISPVKINYLLDQYSGGVGDVVLPMLTPEAESGDDSFLGNMFAPLKSKFTTDAVMNNQNVSDFYSKSEELTTNAKKSNATDEDILKNKYINSVKAEMNELYKEKREIQNSDLPSSEKYNQVREIQGQINELSKSALNSYEDIDIQGNYSSVGDRQFKVGSDGEWEKISGKQLEKQNAVTDMLGISPNEYWNNKEEYDFAYENPSKYAVATAITDYSTFKTYSSDLYDLKADKDSDGKSISGSRKTKVFDYINNLDLEFEQRVMLAKLEYPSYDEYNYEIIEYLNNREDIDYQKMASILTELGFTVDSEGNITWD